VIAVVVISAALLVLALAVLGTGLLTPDSLAPIFGLGDMLVQSVLALLGAVANLLASLWSQLHLPTAPLPQSGPTPVAASEPPAERLVPPPALGLLLMLLWFAGSLALLVLLAAAVFRMLSRLSFREAAAVTGDEDERPEEVAPSEPATILARLVRYFRRIWSTPARLVEPTGARGESSSARFESESIRAAYREYLRWCTRQGLGRRVDQTPDELRDRLSDAYPQLAAEVGLLTSLYIESRYAGRGCSAGDLRQAQLALRRLQRVEQTAGSSRDQPSEASAAGTVSPN
jgi:hypothetical protein